MKTLSKFFWASMYSLFLTPEGGLSLPKLLAMITSFVATYKFVILPAPDPLIWLILLGVLGGHGLAGALLEKLWGVRAKTAAEALKAPVEGQGEEK